MWTHLQAAAPLKITCLQYTHIYIFIFMYYINIKSIRVEQFGWDCAHRRKRQLVAVVIVFVVKLPHRKLTNISTKKTLMHNVISFWVKNLVRNPNLLLYRCSVGTKTCHSTTDVYLLGKHEGSLTVAMATQ